MKKLLFTIGLLFLTPALANSQIEVQIDKNQLYTNEVLQILIKTEGSLNENQFEILGLENFNVVGKNTSQQMQMINNEVQVQLSTTLTLQPKRDGVFELGPITLKNQDGTWTKSKIKTITVTKSIAEATKEKLIQSLEEESAEDTKKKTKKKEESFPKIQKEISVSFYFWGEVIAVFFIGFILVKGVRILKKKRKV